MARSTSNSSSAPAKITWWTAKNDEVHTQVLDTINDIDRRHSDIFERFWRLEVLYDPNAANLGSAARSTEGEANENVIASNVDTVTASIAATAVRARFMTDGADWSTQRTARHLEWYAEGVAKQLDVDEKCRGGFKGCAKIGTGINHVFADPFDRPCVDAVDADDMLVDEAECRNGSRPRQMHRIRRVDREELRAMYPKHDAAIEKASADIGRFRRSRLERRPVNDNEVMAVHSYRLPSGVKGKKGYRPGRETLVIDGATVVDRPYDLPDFPFAVILWSKRKNAWYGISLSERIAGHQRTINKRNWQINRIIDQGASITTYVRPADANIAVKTQNKLGSIAVVKGDYPHTIAAPQVHPEIYQDLERRKAGAFQETGQSQMGAQSVKPAGVDSGAALREYRDQTSQRFAIQEAAFERFVLDTILLVVAVCKQLGKAAPVIQRQTRFGAKKIPWTRVDMGDVRVQIAAASTMSRTPAGRMQTVLEWAQAGVISQDETRRLLQHPDLERAMSLYTAAIESIEHCFEEIADGNVVMPEPFMNLKMCVYRGQLQYLIWRDDGAPENVLESLRQFIVQAGAIVTNSAAAAANDQQAAPGAAPGAPGAAPANDGGPPAEAPPQAAFSPQAMQLMAK